MSPVQLEHSGCTHRTPCAGICKSHLTWQTHHTRVWLAQRLQRAISLPGSRPACSEPPKNCTGFSDASLQSCQIPFMVCDTGGQGGARPRCHCAQPQDAYGARQGWPPSGWQGAHHLSISASTRHACITKTATTAHRAAGAPQGIGLLDLCMELEVVKLRMRGCK